jgi:hypothetical protein
MNEPADYAIGEEVEVRPEAAANLPVALPPHPRGTVVSRRIASGRPVFSIRFHESPGRPLELTGDCLQRPASDRPSP